MEVVKPSVDSYLEHYGVKGMKWGVRRTPEQLGSSRKGSTNVGETDPSLVYASAFLALQGGMVVKNYFESGNARVLKEKGKRFVKGQSGVQYKLNKSLSKPMNETEIMSKVVKDINPDHPGFGTKQNCRRCTMAYEMRRRGYDVTATKTTNARGQHGTGLRKAANTKTGRFDWGENKVFPKGKVDYGDTNEAPNALFKHLAKEPNGSRGEVSIGWALGGGHSIAYEIVKGKPMVIDTQSGKQIKNSSDWSSNYPLIASEVYISRLDNKPLNYAWLERWAKNND